MKHIFTYPTALLVGLALLGSSKADAQQFNKRKQYNSIGFNLSAMNYFGDLAPQTGFPSFRFNNTRPNVGVTITRRFFPRVSGRLGLSYGRITGDDATAANASDQNARYRYNRNANFQNDIQELSAVVIVDLIQNRNNYLKRPDFVPYVFAGVAGFHHNPQGRRADGTYVDLQPLATEGVNYSRFQVAIPFGGGVRYRINRNFDASFELGIRKTFTGYLDDVNKNFVGAAALAGGDAQYFGNGITKSQTGDYTQFAAAGSKRGQNKTDWYTNTGFSLNYILTPRIKNPKFR
ncbi:DUF6089 family protein [Hymenobacter caeli]|uniref:DUF6089 domain-containing protein n=1 Tax=Hymenobacter caeli TaxID=2735894 RepID=A0ABX2FNP1_9BACT|nr:DUF6089 family protein [Hymenobacter caeli]NRT18468.1 hypothetical protein [Hymenobacter caeli]